MSDGGKGSKPRPYSVTQDEYDNRWDAIFGRDLKVKMEMPGTIGSAKIIMKEHDESSDSNSDHRN